MNFITCRRFCHTVAEVLNEGITGKNRVVKGWVKNLRDHKNVKFCELIDGLSPSHLQLVLGENVKSDNLRVGCALEVNGKLIPSQGKGQKYDFIPDAVSIVGSFPETNELFRLGGKSAMDINLNRQFIHLRPKIPTFSSFLRLRSSAKSIIHDFFRTKNFIQIDTPILTSSDCEGAGESFYVEPSEKSVYLTENEAKSKREPEKESAKHYFGRPAFMTVSGQLQLETSACALRRVYTFNPAFRAESSLTRQHLAEFYMLEVELAFVTRLETLMDLTEELFRHCLKELMSKNEEDFKICLEFHNKKHKDCLEKLLKNEKFQRISYTDAVDMIQKTDKQKFRKVLKFGDDLGKDHEEFLVKHFGDIPIFVTHYPADIKPFYMKADSKKMAICFDMLTPYAGEACGGSLREDDYDLLKERIANLNLDRKLDWYCDLRKLGYPKLGGFGLGFERYLQFLLGAHNIKDCLPYPRWYKHCSL